MARESRRASSLLRVSCHRPGLCSTCHVPLSFCRTGRHRPTIIDAPHGELDAEPGNVLRPGAPYTGLKYTKTASIPEGQVPPPCHRFVTEWLGNCHKTA